MRSSVNLHSVRQRAATAACLLVAMLSPLAQAYESTQHQELTFAAAKRFNHCIEQSESARLSALEVRYLVQGNLSEHDAGIFDGATQWSYYDRAERQSEELLWIVETRLHPRYDALAETLTESSADQRVPASRYEDLGAVLHYLQEVTVPANVIPIYYPRPWRWHWGDRFNEWPIDETQLDNALSDVCDEVGRTASDATWQTVLDSAAAATMSAVRGPLGDLPATWRAFWQEDTPGTFGSYGPAGNSFGIAADFDCGDSRCHLVDGDPLYQAFALRQHRLAVLASMRAILIFQRRQRVDRVADGSG